MKKSILSFLISLLNLLIITVAAKAQCNPPDL
jgi:hypothetical protein